jgi:hypothetical protein
MSGQLAGSIGMQPAQQAPSSRVYVRSLGHGVGASQATPAHNKSTHWGQQWPGGVAVSPEGQTGASQETPSQEQTGQHPSGDATKTPSGQSTAWQAQFGPVVFEALVVVVLTVLIVVSPEVPEVGTPPLPPTPPLPSVPAPTGAVAPPQPTIRATIRNGAKRCERAIENRRLR